MTKTTDPAHPRSHSFRMECARAVFCLQDAQETPKFSSSSLLVAKHVAANLSSGSGLTGTSSLRFSLWFHCHIRHSSGVGRRELSLGAAGCADISCSTRTLLRIPTSTGNVSPLPAARASSGYKPRLMRCKERDNVNTSNITVFLVQLIQSWD